MRLVVVVGVGGVLVVCSASGDACKRRSAASTCNSITAYTSRVGAMLRGYRFAMSAILIFSASTAFSTRYFFVYFVCFWEMRGLFRLCLGQG
jgi:TctA family transporter